LIYIINLKMNNKITFVEFCKFSDNITYIIAKLVNQKIYNIRKIFPISIIPVINIWHYENI
jgi:hypothetical protein